MDAKRKGLLGALLLGLLIGPAVALGLSGVFGGDDAAAAPVTTTVPPVVVATTPPTTGAPDQRANEQADLLAACLVDGPSLVDAEANGTITEIEQAGLDALRDICSASGMPLAGAPAAEAQVVEVVQVQPATAAAPSSVSQGEEESEGAEEHEPEEHEYEGEDD